MELGIASVLRRQIVRFSEVESREYNVEGTIWKARYFCESGRFREAKEDFSLLIAKTSGRRMLQLALC